MAAKNTASRLTIGFRMMDTKELCKKYGIGLTGGVGCGKSTIAKILRDKGYITIDADTLSRQIMAPKGPGLALTVDAFGASMLNEDGTLNRDTLGAMVFSDETARKKLETITHPLIETALDEAVKNSGLLNNPKYWFYEATLLYEKNREQDFRQIWSVHCPEEVQLQRLLNRSTKAKGFWEQVISSQLPSLVKAERADVVIDTNCPTDRLLAKVDEALTKLPGLSGIMKIQAKTFI